MKNNLYIDIFRQYLNIISTEEMISIIDGKINSGFTESDLFEFCNKSFYNEQNIVIYLNEYFLNNKLEYKKIKVKILIEFIEMLKNSKFKLLDVYNSIYKFIIFVKNFENLSSNDTPTEFFEIIDDYELRNEGESYFFKNLQSDLIIKLERIKAFYC